MQNILATKSTPRRRAAKRDRAALIGKAELAVIKMWRMLCSGMKALFAPESRGQVALIALFVGLLIVSGLIENLVDGWLAR